MTKNLGTDYEPHEEPRKSSRALNWLFDLLFPLVLVAVGLMVGGYGWPF